MSEQHNASPQATTSSRDQLKAKFADNQRPTGADFSSFIDAVVVQNDDGLTFETGALGPGSQGQELAIIDKSMVLRGDLNLMSALPDTALNIYIDGESHLNAAQLKLGEQVQLDASHFSVSEQLQFVTDSHFSLFNTLNVMHKANSEGSVTIDHDDAVLWVDGDLKSTANIQAEHAAFARSLQIGSSQEQEQILALRNYGHTELNGQLIVADETYMAGPVTIGAAMGDNNLSPALFNLNYTDSTDILHIESDGNPLSVDSKGRLGVGHLNPGNSLDVNGSMTLSANPAALDLEHSLYVENRVGIGTRAPQANLEVLCNSHEDGLSVRQNELSVLSVRTGMDVSHASLNFSGQAQIQGQLTVEQKTQLAETVATGKLTARDELEVSKQLSAGADLHVAGDTKLKNTLAVDGSATLKDGLKVIKETELQDLQVKSASQFEGPVQVMEGAQFEQTLTISADTNLSPLASLHIKEDSSRAAVRLDGNDGEVFVVINEQAVNIGTGIRPGNLNLHGNGEFSGELNIAGELSADGGLSVSQGMVVDLSPQISSDTTGTNAQFSHRFDVQHDNMSLLMTKPGAVGILTDAPEAGLHVSGNAIVEKDLTVNDGLSVGVSGSNATSVSASILEVGAEQLLLNGQHLAQGIQLKGDTFADGIIQVSDWLTMDSGQMMLSQSTHKHAITISSPVTDDKVHIGSGAIGINVNHAEAALHVAGTAKINDSLDAGSLSVNEQFKALGDASFFSDVSCKAGLFVNALPNPEKPADLHVRQSGSGNVALKIEQSSLSLPTLFVKDDKIGINTDAPQAHLSVMGDTQLRGNVETDGNASFAANVSIDKELKLSGPLYCHGPLEVDATLTLGDAATDNGNLLLNGKAHISGETLVDKNLIVAQNIGLGIDKPMAGIHVHNTQEQTALKVEGDTPENAQLVVQQGKVGIGMASPKHMLDVAGTTHVADELAVDGRTYLNSSLDVAQDTNIKSDLFVLEKSRLREQTILGVPAADMVEVKSQLYIADTSYAEALRIDSKKYGSIVIKDGRLGIGNDDPAVALNVTGAVDLTENLTVGGAAQINGKLEVEDQLNARGTLEVSKKSEFGSDVHISGDLRVEDRLMIEETLSVTGETQLDADLRVNADTAIGGALTVALNTHLQQQLDVDGTLTVKEDLRSEQAGYVKHKFGVGVSTANSALHIQSKGEQSPLQIEHQFAGDVPKPLLNLNCNGDLGLGVPSPGAKLDVRGNANISGKTDIGGHLQASSISSASNLNSASLNIQQQLQLGSGPVITGISEDIMLGGDTGLNAVIPTQAAVKSYIDNVVVPFGRGGKTHTISSQIEFDRVFNKDGFNANRISENTTVILLPLNNQDFGTTAYMLKGTVTLASNVSIVGFNRHTTVIRKQNPGARFELKGTSSHWVNNVTLSGFTFDGNNINATQNGGAFYLEYARDCQLNCYIEKHRVTGNGAGIYAKTIGEEQFTAFNIEALYISHCQALEANATVDNQRNEGGGAWGLCDSQLHISHCKADQGGAVAWCKDSKVQASYCKATNNGGGAYRCNRLILGAKDCSAGAFTGDTNGKGGGAYYCSDLMCEGFWTGNNAGEGPHIYANNNLTDSYEERHYWRGDYVGRKLDAGESGWRVHNE